jgi:hypothetical protein
MEHSINTYEISPDQERAFYQTLSAFGGQVAAQKNSKEELLSEHLKNLALLRSPKDASRRSILPAAYSPSRSSLDPLQKVHEAVESDTADQG